MATFTKAERSGQTATRFQLCGAPEQQCAGWVLRARQYRSQRTVAAFCVAAAYLSGWVVRRGLTAGSVAAGSLASPADATAPGPDWLIAVAACSR